MIPRSLSTSVQVITYDTSKMLMCGLHSSPSFELVDMAGWPCLASSTAHIRCRSQTVMMSSSWDLYPLCPRRRQSQGENVTAHQRPSSHTNNKRRYSSVFRRALCTRIQDCSLSHPAPAHKATSGALSQHQLLSGNYSFTSSTSTLVTATETYPYNGFRSQLTSSRQEV